MPAILPAVAAGLSIVNGVKGMTSKSSTPSAGQAQQMADPFAQYRGLFAGNLLDFLPKLLNPNYQGDEGYNFIKNQALDAAGNATRSMVGSERSGALPQEAARIASGLAGGYVNQIDNRNMGIAQLLGSFAGAGASPAGGAQAALQAGQMGINNQNNNWAMIGGGLNLAGRVNWGDIGSGFSGSGTDPAALNTNFVNGYNSANYG